MKQVGQKILRAFDLLEQAADTVEETAPALNDMIYKNLLSYKEFIMDEWRKQFFGRVYNGKN